MMRTRNVKSMQNVMFTIKCTAAVQKYENQITNCLYFVITKL